MPSKEALCDRSTVALCSLRGTLYVAKGLKTALEQQVPWTPQRISIRWQVTKPGWNRCQCCFLPSFFPFKKGALEIIQACAFVRAGSRQRHDQELAASSCLRFLHVSRSRSWHFCAMGWLGARYFCEHLGNEGYHKWVPHAESERVCKSVDP